MMLCASEGAKASDRILRNFLLMSAFFAANHGTVTSLIALASGALGRTLGNASSALLYFVYTLSAAFVSNYFTARFGAKKTLFAGLSIYCFYVVSYLVAYVSPPGVMWVAVLIGAVLGGFAAGIIWPAQGSYYAESAERYARETGITREAANSLLGGYFSSTYLGFEVAMKLFSSIIPMIAGETKGIVILFLFFSLVACTSAALTSTIDPLTGKDVKSCQMRVFSSSASGRSAVLTTTTRDVAPAAAAAESLDDDDADAAASLASEGGGGETTQRQPDFGKKALQALTLLVKDPKCRCMIPMNFVFGLGSSYVNGYFDGVVVTGEMGVEDVGFVSAVVVGSATVFALVYGELGRRRKGDQAPLVVWGALCISSFAAVNLAFSTSALGKWSVAVPLATLFGSGRAIWEGSFKATFADYFPNDLEAAFANVVIQSGLASTIGFFLVFAAPLYVVGGLVIFFGALAAVAQLYASRLHKRQLAGLGQKVATFDDHYVAVLSDDGLSVPGGPSTDNGETTPKADLV
mmetsp:Transcript_9487/g.30993  ORF Transcript_9487/g.30993 Transcript_9487/m.30993 type:complete len:521 (-) Transcript_9487:95-1657(-)